MGSDTRAWCVSLGVAFVFSRNLALAADGDLDTTFGMLGKVTTSLAKVGRQEELIGTAVLWVLPNPSGLNANYQLGALTEMFIALRVAAEEPLL